MDGAIPGIKGSRSIEIPNPDAEGTVDEKLTLLALALVTAGAAAGRRARPPTTPPATSSRHPKTRAQVQAELMRARADGSIKVWSTRTTR